MASNRKLDLFPNFSLGWIDKIGSSGFLENKNKIFECAFYLIIFCGFIGQKAN